MSQKFLSSVTLAGLASGSILKVNSDGLIVEAVAGTDYVSSVSPGNLNALTDVVISNPSADQILVYGQPLGGDPGVNIWYNKTPNYLTSYTETDPIYTASSWYTTTNNASNWNTAYGWGNHSGLYANLIHTHSVFTQATSGIANGEEVIVAGENGFVPASGFDDGLKFLRGDATWQTAITDLTGYATETWVGQQGYLTSYTETDPVFAASDVFNVRTADITNWNTAFGWGDHNDVGYLTSYTETDPVYTASSWYTTTNNSTNWDTAYGWGNHAGLYVPKTWNFLESNDHGYCAYDALCGWRKIASVTLNGNCQSLKLWGFYRDLGYTDTGRYDIEIVARAECDFLENNESHHIYATIVAATSHTSNITDKVRVVLVGSDENRRDYEVQFYRESWDNGYWQLQNEGGWNVWADHQAPTQELGEGNVHYTSKVLANEVYMNGSLVATRSWVGSQGYLTSYTETDPIYTASSWYTTTNNASNWDTAYGWGNHALAGYLTAETDSQTLEWNQGEKTLTISNGNTVDLSQMASVQDVEAYGFITGESDTLATVTGRGNSTSSNITVKRPSNKIDNNSNPIEFGGRVEFNNDFVAGESGYMVFRYPTYNNFLIGGDYDGNIGGGIPNIQFGRSNGTVYMHIDANGGTGNVGIGTTSPTYKLQVAGSTYVGGDLTSTGYGFFNGEGLGASLRVGGIFGNLGLYVPSTYDMQFDLGWDGVFKFTRGNTERMRIVGSTGNVGIGTNAPSEKLHVAGSIKASGGLYSDNGALAGNIGLGQVTSINSSFTSYANLQFTMHNGGGFSDIMKLQGNGNVGIGTTSPAYKLDVTGGDVRLSQDYNRVRINGIDLLGYGSGNLWQLGNTSYSSLVLSTDWNWDTQVEFNYTPNTIGQASGVLRIGQLQKNSTTWTHGRTDFYVNGAVRSNINTHGVGINREAASNEKLAIDLSDGIWGVHIYNAATPIGGLHANSSVITLQSDNNRNIEIATGTGNANWNGDTLATRPWVAAQGYLTSESDTLATVTARGNSTNAGIVINGDALLYTLGSSNNITLQYSPGNADGQIRGQIIFDTPGSEPSYVNGGDAYKWKIATVGSLGTGPAYYNSDLRFLRTTRTGVTDSAVMTLSGFTGNVGIGTTSPAFTLDVNGNAAIGTKLSVGTAYNGFALNVAGTAYIIGGSVWTQNGYGYVNSGATGTGMFPDSNHVITFKNNNSANVTIDASGNVGIGTTSPTGKLSVNGGISQNNIVGRPKAYWGVGGGSNGAIVISFPGSSNNYGMVHAVVDIYEYNSNNVSTVIVGGHNWNGRWYAYGANTVGYTDKQIRVSYKDGRYAIIIGDENSSWSYGQVVLRKIQNGDYYAGTMNVSDGYDITQTQDLTADWMSENLAGLKTNGDLTVNGTASITGTLFPQATQFFVNQTSQLNVDNQGTFARFAFNKLDFYDWQWGSILTLDGGEVSSTGLMISTAGVRGRKAQTAGNYTTAALWTESYDNTTTGIAFHISGNVGKFLEMRTNGILYWNGDTVLHSGNYSSWAATAAQGTKADTAYSWGNHATANYWVTSNPDPQIVAASSVTFQYDVEIQGQLLETSSIRFKENIVDLEPVGDKVSQLRPVRYNKIGSEAQEIGLIAEEVAELFPEVVHYNEDGEAESLNYTRLSVLLLQTVKELSDRIQKLENK